MQGIGDFYCFRLGAISRRIARYYNDCYTDLGITFGQSFVLYYLIDHDGSNVKEIATAVQLDSPGVTSMTDRLVKQGLVLRQEDPNDRRSTQIFLTSEGRRIAEEAIKIVLKLDPYLKKHLAEGTITGLEQTMAELEQELQANKDRCAEIE